MAESLRCRVKEHLTCSICLKQFDDPKVLPCLHSYCHGCIVSLAQNAKSNTFNCPDCRLAVEINKHTISSLPKNFFVNNLLATMTLTNEKTAAKKILCDNCDSEDDARGRCSECGVFLCNFCTVSHRRSRSTKNHKLLTVEELKSNPGPQNIAEKIRCPKHKEEVIKLFCKTCQTTICRDCTIVDHRQHEYGFVEDVAVEEKGNLRSNLDEVKERKIRVMQGISNIKDFEKRLKAKHQSTVSEINVHFDEFIKAVEYQRSKMIKKSTMHTNSKQKQIHAQLEVLEMALASCESSIEFTEQAFKNGNDVQILSMEKYILQSLEQMKAVKDQTTPSVPEDMAFIIPSSVKETKKNLLNEYDVDVAWASPGNCKASFEEGKTPVTSGEQHVITLICYDEKKRRLRYGGHVIKPSFTGLEVSDVAVTDNNDGSYTIWFRPIHGGMLKFEVSINGMPAPNCSLTKQVKWTISDVYGQGTITDGGLAMNAVGQSYCWRVGGCYFESGVHTWRVQVSFQSYNQGQTLGLGYNNFFNNYPENYNNQILPSCTAEVGIIDYDEVNADVVNSQKKWVYQVDYRHGNPSIISLTLNMESRQLSIVCGGFLVNRDFDARRVSPFFACSSSAVSIRLLQ